MTFAISTGIQYARKTLNQGEFSCYQKKTLAVDVFLVASAAIAAILIAFAQHHLLNLGGIETLGMKSVCIFSAIGSSIFIADAIVLIIDQWKKSLTRKQNCQELSRHESGKEEVGQTKTSEKKIEKQQVSEKIDQELSEKIADDVENFKQRLNELERESHTKREAVRKAEIESKKILDKIESQKELGRKQPIIEVDSPMEKHDKSSEEEKTVKNASSQNER
jgi:hypothetical protein